MPTGAAPHLRQQLALRDGVAAQAIGDDAARLVFETGQQTLEEARVNALLSGKVQLAAAINPRSMRLVDSQPGVWLSKTTAGNYTDLNIRLDMSPGDQADFITGMKYVVNREQIQKSAMRGLAEIANEQPISPDSTFHNKDLKLKALDLGKAKFHFQRSGLMGQSIPIVASEAAGSSLDMAVIVQQAGNATGMKFDIQRVPSDGYWSNYWLKSPMHFGNVNPRLTPDILFSLLYSSAAPWNESRYKSDKFDAMLMEARGLLDQAKRREIYNEMEVMVSEQAGPSSRSISPTSTLRRTS